MSRLPGARADLVCNLVVTAVATYALTSDWRMDHVTFSCRPWLSCNRLSLLWLDRIRLGPRALQIASRDLLGVATASQRADFRVSSRAT